MASKSKEVRRLSKRELGPYAFEQQMPAEITAIIKGETSQNKLNGIVPALAKLLKQDSRVETAYLCHEETTQVYKLPGEGNHFCGYRNIQMLLLHRQPSIPELQDMIETAWDNGYNPHGRTETDGIRGTRKHIGTSEVVLSSSYRKFMLTVDTQAQALFQSLNVPCTAQVFTGKEAWRQLLNSIEEYYKSCTSSSSIGGVHRTKLPPVYLQRPRHSITVVGIERLRSDRRRLLCFDPGYRPLKAWRKAPGSSPSSLFARLVLWTYQRDEDYLKRYQSFEALFLDAVS